MQENKENSAFSIVLGLALKTLWYSIVFGALTILLTCIVFPTLAEDFYATAGNAKMSYQFAVKATGENADAKRLIKTTDKAISLMEKDNSYSDDVEVYCKKLLEKQGVDSVFATVDAINVKNVPKQWQVNVCDSRDYYATAMLRARLNANKPLLYVNGNEVALENLRECLTDQLALSYEAAHLLNQLSLYIEYKGESFDDAVLSVADVTSFCEKALGAALNELDADNPSLKQLFRLKALYKFYNNSPETTNSWGSVEGFGELDTVKKLYEHCFEKYCDTNEDGGLI